MTMLAPRQAALFRMIDGALRNAQHAHPEIRLSKTNRASIAKRAAGTVSASMPGLLAAPHTGPSVSVRPGTIERVAGRRRQLANGQTPADAPTASSTTRSGLGPLRKLRKQIVHDLWKEENIERKKALVHVLRLIADLGVRR